MQAPSPAGLLGAWEQACAETPPARALALLGAVFPDTPAADLESLSIGQRDAALLSLRERAFGARLPLLLTCAACQQALELEVTVDDVRETAIEPDDVQTLAIEHHGYRVEFRVPCAGDLVALAAARCFGPSALLDRCVTSARCGEHAVSTAELPESLVTAVQEAMRLADPQAEVMLAVECSACATDFRAPFDIASFLWAEVDAWATRTLYEVHLLASAYGWRESDVLALGPRRRWHYLRLAAAS